MVVKENLVDASSQKLKFALRYKIIIMTGKKARKNSFKNQLEVQKSGMR